MKLLFFVFLTGIVVSGQAYAQSEVPDWAQPAGTAEALERQAAQGYQAPNAFEMMGNRSGGKGAPNAFEVINKRQEERARANPPNALNNPPNAFEMMGNRSGGTGAPNAFEIMNRRSGN